MGDLSDHFSLSEFEQSQTALQRGIVNRCPPELVQYLRTLAVVLLEPVRAQFGPLIVTSGYRCPALNAAVGGVPNSEHTLACAADVVPVGGWTDTLTREAVVGWLAASTLPYDQAIDEGNAKGSRWVHIGMAPPGQDARRQALLFRDGVYVPFNVTP
jgi:zinc D-Ala-D-Ala carboxypeptidase